MYMSIVCKQRFLYFPLNYGSNYISYANKFMISSKICKLGDSKTFSAFPSLLFWGFGISLNVRVLYMTVMVSFTGVFPPLSCLSVSLEGRREGRSTIFPYMCICLHTLLSHTGVFLPLPCWYWLRSIGVLCTLHFLHMRTLYILYMQHVDIYARGMEHSRTLLYVYINQVIHAIGRSAVVLYFDYTNLLC